MVESVAVTGFALIFLRGQNCIYMYIYSNCGSATLLFFFSDLCTMCNKYPQIQSAPMAEEMWCGSMRRQSRDTVSGNNVIFGPRKGESAKIWILSRITQAFIQQIRGLGEQRHQTVPEVGGGGGGKSGNLWNTVHIFETRVKEREHTTK
jgi:hypothetical protein